MIWLFTLITVCYLLLILSLVYGFEKIEVFKPELEFVPINFSVVIPFRNESENLPELLASLDQLEYPTSNFEILLVDDFSEDTSVSIIENFIKNHKTPHIRILKNNATGKKQAIAHAIKNARFPWVVSTDADCTLPKKWLQTYADFINRSKVKMVCGLVTYPKPKKKFDAFQDFEFSSLLASTVGGFGIQKPFLCNGANLCYQKEVFIEVNGHEGNKHIASGDDLFLLEKILQKYPNQVQLIKSTDNLVHTKPQKNWDKLLNQRIRWASKTATTKLSFNKYVGAIVFLMNLFLIGSVYFYITNNCLQTVVLITVAKFTVDYLLLLKMYRLTEKNTNFWMFVISSLVYPFFCVLVVFLSTYRGYQWKGKTYKR